MKKEIIVILIALVVVIGLAVSVHSEETFDEDLWNYEQTVIAELNSALKSMGYISFVKDSADKGCLTALTNQQDSDFIEWTEDTGETQVRYTNSLSLAITLFDLDSIEFWAGQLYRDCTERLVKIDKFDVSPAMQPAKNEFKKYLQDLKQFAYYCEKGAKELDTDDLDTSVIYIESASEHLRNFFDLIPEDTETIPEDTEEIPTFPLVDNLSLSDAIVISIGNATVTDFLNATNMTTVQVSNFKGYKGENTLRVQWSFSNRLLDVYINVTTGSVVGIEEKTCLSPTPTIEEAAVEEIKENVVGAVEESRYNVSAYPPFDSEEMKIVMITEEIDSGGSLSLRIIIESKGKEYTFGVRKSHYWDDETREEVKEHWLEHIRELEEEAERDWSLSP